MGESYEMDLKEALVSLGEYAYLSLCQETGSEDRQGWREREREREKHNLRDSN
jgi:hypothetical protein